MKDFRGMKRQRSRNRKPAGNSNNPNRAYESNGPEGTKVRGNAQTIYEKYQQLARDANSSGDRVLAENHLQHAEHYFRMIRQMQPTRPVSEFVQRDPFSSGFDDDYEDVEVEATDTESDASGDEQPSDEPRYESRERNTDRGDRNNRDRDNRNNRDRDNRNNRDRNNEQRSFEPRNNNQPRDSEPQYDENGNRRETRRERYERRRQQRFAEQEANLNAPVSISAPAAEYTAPAFIASTQPLGARPAAQPDLGFEAPAAEAPVKEKRERPERKPRAEASDNASQLPAFLHRPAPVAADAPAPEPEAKPKRTRKKKEDASASEEA